MNTIDADLAQTEAKQATEIVDEKAKKVAEIIGSIEKYEKYFNGLDKNSYEKNSKEIAGMKSTFDANEKKLQEFISIQNIKDIIAIFKNLQLTLTPFLVSTIHEMLIKQSKFFQSTLTKMHQTQYYENQAINARVNKPVNDEISSLESKLKEINSKIAMTNRDLKVFANVKISVGDIFLSFEKPNPSVSYNLHQTADLEESKQLENIIRDNQKLMKTEMEALIREMEQRYTDLVQTQINSTGALDTLSKNLQGLVNSKAEIEGRIDLLKTQKITIDFVLDVKYTQYEEDLKELDKIIQEFDTHSFINSTVQLVSFDDQIRAWMKEIFYKNDKEFVNSFIGYIQLLAFNLLRYVHFERNDKCPISINTKLKLCTLLVSKFINPVNMVRRGSYDDYKYYYDYDRNNIIEYKVEAIYKLDTSYGYGREENKFSHYHQDHEIYRYSILYDTEGLQQLANKST